MATILPCATYQEFYEVLLRIEDFDKMPSESEEEEEEKGSNLKSTIKAKGSHLRDLDRLRVLRKVGLVLVLLVGVLVPPVRREVVGSLEDLSFRGQERQVVQVLLYAVGAIIDILQNVVKAT